MKNMNGIQKTVLAGGSIAVLIATPIIARLEGTSLTPYQDIGGVWTVCQGLTNVEMTTYTSEQCEAMLKREVADFWQFSMRQIPNDIQAEVPITMQAAITSFTYNVGPEAFRKSTMLKKINKKDFWGACKELDRWVYVGRMWVKGLANRREAEKRLCVAELPAEI